MSSIQYNNIENKKQLQPNNLGNKIIDNNDKIEKFIKKNKQYLPTEFDDLKVFTEYKQKKFNEQNNDNNINVIPENQIQKEANIKWYDITKSDHPLWINENTLPKRLTRFVDERYILTDTNNSSQQLLVILGIIIIIITIIELFIREYKKDKYNIQETNVTLNRVLAIIKLISGCIFLYYFIPNIVLRTSKPNDDIIQLGKSNRSIIELNKLRQSNKFFQSNKLFQIK